MKKVFPTMAIVVAVALAATGCDFLRRLAGRPTSAQIRAKAAAIMDMEREAEEERLAREAARLDSARVADSLATVERGGAAASAKPDAGSVPQKPTAGSRQDGKKRYYIVLASFSNRDNATKFVQKMAQRGYPAELLGFKGGYTGVGICGTDDGEQAKASLMEVKRQDFCPEGAWILDRNKR